MQISENFDKLVAALAKAQGKIGGAAKTAENPHFHSKYADLASVIAAMREPFAEQGLAVHQGPRVFGEDLRLVTRIMLADQWMEDDGYPLLLDKQTMQGLGSATTYARRYGLMAAAGIAPEDDDGNLATGKGNGKPVTVKRGTGSHTEAMFKASVQTGMPPQGKRAITLQWADGKTREFPYADKPSSIKAALAALSALEKACEVNPDNWPCNASQMTMLAEKIPEAQENSSAPTFATRVNALALAEPNTNLGAG